MGIIKKQDVSNFTIDNIKDRELILKMLRYEDELIHSEEIEKMYADNTYKPRQSLFIEHTIQRIVLNHFNFSTSDENVSNYRLIFNYYYDSPIKYDKEVLNSVTYMRENKLLYYKEPDILIGDNIKNLLAECFVIDSIDNSSKSLFDISNNLGFKEILVGGFSTT